MRTMDYNNYHGLGLLLTAIVISSLTTVCECESCSTVCSWVSWNAWSDCSATCGGGTRSRDRPLCCQSDQSVDECLSFCGLSLADALARASEEGDCNEFCYNSGTFMQGSDYCKCSQAYYGSCCSNKITCGHPGNLDNGQVIGSNYDYGGVITYTCNEHYNLTGGSYQRTCNSFANVGVWSGTKPHCAFVNSCASNPCQNEGTCVNELNQYTCHCATGWSGTNCEIDMLPPSVDNCQADFNISSSERKVNVSWSLPAFVDDHGFQVDVTSNYLSNVQMFFWDEYTAQYVGSKPSNGLQTVCETHIGVYPHQCTPLPTISNGTIVCNGWNSRFTSVCVVMCEDDRDVATPTDVQQLYVCGGSGQWTPTLTLSGCTEHRSSIDKQSAPSGSERHYYSGQCEDPAAQSTIRQQYLDILQDSEFASLCTHWEDCSLETVSVKC